MKQTLFLFIFIFCNVHMHAQSASSYAVHLEVEAIEDPLSLVLTWDEDATATGYNIFRKSPGDASFGTAIANLTGSDTSYTDNAINLGDQYEYAIRKSSTSAIGYGYAHSSVLGSLAADHGDLLLIVESGIAAGLESEINDLMGDLKADGWQPHKYVVQADTTVAHVKQYISDAHFNMTDLTMVYLLGHVPVPYSGNLNPDGHSNHIGAWPADVFYAELDGNWSDNTVNNSSASDSRNHNIPGDGKLDQSTIPSPAELMIGRVDFANMPEFSESEMELTRRYLERVHLYKNGVWTLPLRALIDDNFGGFNGEAFAANGWRNFSPLVGREQISSLDYRTTLNSDGYLFSYGCGGGTFTSAGGIGTSAQLATDSLLTGFTMLFGSYFGDWDRPDNFLRSALAQGRTMSISWAGRPHWHYQSMGSGLPIGYSALLSQNNTTTYWASYGARFVHVALLGDPSLRMEYLMPPSALSADTLDTFHIQLNWTASDESSIDGYNVYQRVNDSPWFKRNSSPISATSYVDSCVLYSGEYEYMVKTVKKIENYSGSYWNESLGVTDSVEILETKVPEATHIGVQVQHHDPDIRFKADPNKWTSSVKWLVESNVLSGDSLVYSSTLDPFETHPYQIVLSNSCVSDTLNGGYVWYIGAIDELLSKSIHIWPNPVEAGSNLFFESDVVWTSASLYSIDGRKIQDLSTTKQSIQLTNSTSGAYILILKNDDQVISRNRIIVR